MCGRLLVEMGRVDWSVLFAGSPGKFAVFGRQETNLQSLDVCVGSCGAFLRQTFHVWIPSIGSLAPRW